MVTLLDQTVIVAGGTNIYTKYDCSDFFESGDRLFIKDNRVHEVKEL